MGFLTTHCALAGSPLRKENLQTRVSSKILSRLRVRSRRSVAFLMLRPIPSYGSFDSTAKSGRLTTRTFWHMHTNVPYIVHAEPTSVVDDLCDTLQTDVIRVAVDGNQAGHSCILFIVMVVRLFGRSSRTRLFMYESPKSTRSSP